MPDAVDLVYLNLGSATARRDAFERDYAACGFAPHWQMRRFHAIDAQHALVRNARGPLSPGNKGCWHSSLECLREHFDSGRHLFILDDDILFAPQAQGFIDLALASLAGTEWDLLFTDTIVPNAFDMPRLLMQRHEYDQSGELQLLDLAAPGFTFCAGSTLIHRDAKRKIHALMSMEELVAPWDLVMRLHIQQGRLRAFLTFPFLTAVSRLGDESQIKPDDPNRQEHALTNAFRRMMWLGHGPAPTAADGADAPHPEVLRFNEILTPLLSLQLRQRWFRRAA